MIHTLATVSVNNLPEEAINATWRDRLLKPRAKSKKLIMALWHYTVATSRTDIQDLGMSRFMPRLLIICEDRKTATSARAFSFVTLHEFSDQWAGLEP